MITLDDVRKHNTPESCWLVIDSTCYDLTDFAPSHPGGARAIISMAGKDATTKFNLFHSPGTLDSLDASYNLGPVGMGAMITVTDTKAPSAAISSVRKQGEQKSVEVIAKTMSLIDCLSLDDFETAARQSLSAKAWAYYSSAADDELTLQTNRESYRYVSFRPRALKNVETIDLSTKILGFTSSLPIFIAPAAMGRLANNDGEQCLSRVANSSGIPYIVSANASISFEELASNSDTQTMMYQVYINKDRKITEAILLKVKAAGYRAIVVTVDAPVSGKREKDERNTIKEDEELGGSIVSQSVASLAFSYLDATFSWEDLDWLRRCTDLPLVVKGIQSVEDALLCSQYHVDVIYLSNHGGRQLDGSPSALETLQEIRTFAPKILESTEIWLDGGIRRGTDVLKAVALGATAVGIGRGFMYSLLFGDDGVQAVVNIMAQELATGLRLLGCTNLKELNSTLVNTRRLENLLSQGSLSNL